MHAAISCAAGVGKEEVALGTLWRVAGHISRPNELHRGSAFVRWRSSLSRALCLARYVTRPNMKPALLPISMAVAAALTVAAVSSRAQAPGVYALHEVPEGATLHKVTADPAEYNGRNALNVEFTGAANTERPGVGGDMPTFVLIPTNFKNGTIEVDLLGRLNGKGLPDARAFVGLAYRVDDEAHFEAVYL